MRRCPDFRWEVREGLCTLEGRLGHLGMEDGGLVCAYVHVHGCVMYMHTLSKCVGNRNAFPI